MNPRQISIFNYLLEQNDYVTAKTISKEFNVTPKNDLYRHKYITRRIDRIWIKYW